MAQKAAGMGSDTTSVWKLVVAKLLATRGICYKVLRGCASIATVAADFIILEAHFGRTHLNVFMALANLTFLASQSTSVMPVGSCPLLLSRVHEPAKSLRLCGERPSKAVVVVRYLVELSMPFVSQSLRQSWKSTNATSLNELGQVRGGSIRTRVSVAGAQVLWFLLCM